MGGGTLPHGPNSGGPPRGGRMEGMGRRDRGGLARGPRKALAAPKRQRVLKIDGEQNKTIVTK